MRSLILTACLVVATIGAQAQQTKTATLATTTKTQSPVAEEQRAMSGTLKETLGQLEQIRGAVKKAANDPALAERTPKLNASMVDMADLSKAIEGMLSKVNTATPDNWKAVKAEAEALNTRALETAAAAKQLTVVGK
jgi:hypothetical protein